MDSAHRVIEGASVLITRPAHQTRTGADGRFVIDDLEPGRYELSVRRFGYEMAVQEHQVTESGSIARFCLVPRTIRLAPVITSAKRLGLSGVIGDSTYQPLPGAEVRVVATRAPVLTDAAGGFFIPLRPGTYGVLVSKSGYGRQLLSVTVPKDSGREIAVWLGSIPRNSNRMFAAYDDMRSRLLTASANRSALLSAEDLERTSADLQFAAQAAIRAPVSHGCAAVIDGGPYTLPLALIPKEEVAMMEVYLAKRPRSAPASMNPGGTSRGRVISTTPARKPTGCGLVDVYIWMK